MCWHDRKWHAVATALICLHFFFPSRHWRPAYDHIIIPRVTLLGEYLHAAAGHWHAVYPCYPCCRLRLTQLGRSGLAANRYAHIKSSHETQLTHRRQADIWALSATFLLTSLGRLWRWDTYRSIKWGCAFCQPEISWLVFACSSSSSLVTVSAVYTVKKKSDKFFLVSIQI